CAGKGLPEDLVSQFSTFNTQELIPYAPHYLAGWRAEAYAVELMPAWGMGQQKMAQVQQGRCSGDVGGDTHRSLMVQNNFTRVTFKHVLLPIWIAAYRYNQKTYRFLVNGQTGEVVGKAPYSFWKIFFLVAGILTAIGVGVGIYWYTQEMDDTPPPPVTPRPVVSVTAPPVPTPVPTMTAAPTATSTVKKPGALPTARPTAKPSGAPTGSAKPVPAPTAKPSK
ncbi:MAG: hypothetical protein HOO96_19075, partial [Polyangiaceae bacterium]|nr:hypothetical protein [Polyangiaceae bacterium]